MSQNRKEESQETDANTEKDAIPADAIWERMRADGMDPCAYNPDGYALLHKTAAVGKAETLRIMLDLGADPELRSKAQDNLGWTPLHYAACNGQAESIELLIAHGANVNATCDELNTPLQLAAYGGHAQAASVLLAHGADPSMRDDTSKSALDYALQEGHSGLAPLLEGSGKPEDNREARLGYSLCAMLNLAKENGLFEEEATFPVIPEALPLFSRASQHFCSIITSQDPTALETMMHHTCRYLWGKAIEAAFLWAKSPDGNISINFEPGEIANQTITTDLPAELEATVQSEMGAFLPYFEAHQQAMLTHQSDMVGEQFESEIAVTLDYFPKLGMAYAIMKGYHEMQW